MSENQNESDLVKKLREEIKQRDAKLNEVETEFTTLKKKSAFSDLGINTESGVGRLFFESYNGDSDPEEIAKAVQDYGLDPSVLGGSTPAPTAPSEEKKDEAQQHAAIDAASSGSSGVGATDIDPSEKARQTYDKAFAETGNNETAMAAFFGSKLESAIEAKRK